MKIKAFIFILMLCLTLSFSSCAQKSYESALSCSELSAELEKEFSLADGDFKKYSDEDINFLFSSEKLYDDACVSYSADSVDVCELGIFHSSNEEDAKKLFEDVKLYIKNSQEQKSDFIRSYAPEELSKLNSAEARKYGNYVIFTVADSEQKSKIFEKAEKLFS